jgi:hypothetical protein
MAFKQKSGSPFLRNFGVGKSPVKQKSPMKSTGGKFKFEGVDEEGFDITKQISDQEYAEIQARKADVQAQGDILAAERDANPNKNSLSIYDRKMQDLYRDNPEASMTTFAQGLDETEYKSIDEAKQALSTMDPASQEYRDLKEIINFEGTDRGKKMTDEQRRLSLDKS